MSGYDDSLLLAYLTLPIRPVLVRREPVVPCELPGLAGSGLPAQSTRCRAWPMTILGSRPGMGSERIELTGESLPESGSPGVTGTGSNPDSIGSQPVTHSI